LIDKIDDFLKFFPGAINNEGILESLCSLRFKEIESKFLLQIRNIGSGNNKFKIKMIYIAFGEDDFQDKKAVFFDLMKTLLFLFSSG